MLFNVVFRGRYNVSISLSSFHISCISLAVGTILFFIHVVTFSSFIF